MEPQITISRTEKPHSYEFGKAVARVKLYFEDAKELKALMDSLALIGVPSIE